MRRESEYIPDRSDEIDVVKTLRQGTEDKFNWVVIEEYPEKILLGANIRERSDALIQELAISIAKRGQLQECTVDILANGQIRVVAGQHRY